MKWLKILSFVLLVLYSAFCGFLYFAQDYFIFDPRPLAKNYEFSEGEEVNIEVEKGISLNCLWLKENVNPDGVILYLHGTRGSNRRCLRQARSMMGNNYDIFMPDYRGYGKSDGKIISESQLFSDMEKIYQFLLSKYDESQIVIVGYSLGSGMASYLAAKYEPSQLILLAPFISITNLKNRMLPIVPDWLVKYPLSTEKYMPEVKCPVTLFHGTRDDIIPFDSSQKLQAQAPEKIALITIENEGHRGVIFSGAFRNGVRKLLN